jgi:hypothetical protein
MSNVDSWSRDGPTVAAPAIGCLLIARDKICQVQIGMLGPFELRMDYRLTVEPDTVDAVPSTVCRSMR